MTRRDLVLAFPLAVAVGKTASAEGQVQTQVQKDRVDWVAATLKRMETITPGMTRTDLLTVFTTEGGLSTDLERVYVSQECPYFKVDVKFRPVGADGRATLVEGPDDVIVDISRPFLALSVID